MATHNSIEEKREYCVWICLNAAREMRSILSPVICGVNMFSHGFKAVCPCLFLLAHLVRSLAASSSSLNPSASCRVVPRARIIIIIIIVISSCWHDPSTLRDDVCTSCRPPTSSKKSWTSGTAPTLCETWRKARHGENHGLYDLIG